MFSKKVGVFKLSFVSYFSDRVLNEPIRSGRVRKVVWGYNQAGKSPKVKLAMRNVYGFSSSAVINLFVADQLRLNSNNNRVVMWRLSPHLESKPCSAQPACDADHVTSRRCWRLQEGCLEHVLIGGVTFAFFSLSELRRRKLFWVLFWIWNKQQQQATTAKYFSSTSTFSV